ncbi:MAG: hypothetical protein IPJ14_14530 [Kineosporiaceae bacterium]|nr:hypothetical protein [Kineosporiaceae bacterium]
MGRRRADGARNAVQVYVSRLRKALGAGGRALRAGPGGYVLDLPEAAVDAVRFRRLADTGHALLREGHAEAAREVLGQALALWRGEALPDLGAAGQGLRAGLEAGRLAVRTALVRAGLDLGHHHALISELEELVRRHPLDEQLVVLQMTALFRAGRQADALAAYAAAARRLADELGIDPGTELRRMHESVLRQEVSLPETSTGAEPAPQPPPAVPSSRPPIRPGRPLVGRAADLARVRAHLTDPAVRVITLLGPGGAGKTRLAMEVATQWPDDVFVVALAGTEDPASVVPEICRVAGAAPAWASEPALDVATRALGGRRLLLVLDNLEQLIDRPGTDHQGLAGLDELIARLPELTVLCTSRSPVGLPAEYLIPIGPLPVPSATASTCEEVLDSDAVRLFRDRARAAMPEFEVTEQNAADVAAVCRMLDGLPLALELAAARVRLMPPAVLVRREADGSTARWRTTDPAGSTSQHPRGPRLEHHPAGYGRTRRLRRALGLRRRLDPGGRRGGLYPTARGHAGARRARPAGRSQPRGGRRQRAIMDAGTGPRVRGRDADPPARGGGRACSRGPQRVLPRARRAPGAAVPGESGRRDPVRSGRRDGQLRRGARAAARRG